MQSLALWMIFTGVALLVLLLFAINALTGGKSYPVSDRVAFALCAGATTLVLLFISGVI